METKTLNSSRKRKSTVAWIEDRGRINDNQHQIKETFMKYYSNLLGTPEKTLIQLNWEALYSEPPENLSELEAPFSEEIKNALFSLARDKSSGLEGFSISFYQHFWDTIKKDLIRFFFRHAQQQNRPPQTELFLHNLGTKKK